MKFPRTLVYTVAAILLIAIAGLAFLGIRARQDGRGLGEEFQAMFRRKPYLAPIINTGQRQPTAPITAQTPPPESAIPNSAVQTQETAQRLPVPTRPQPPVTTPASPQPKPYEVVHQNAEQALAAHRYIDPPEDSAVYWARRAAALGDPNATTIEQQVLTTMTTAVSQLRQAHNYTDALALNNRLVTLFPARSDLSQTNLAIQQEQQQYLQQQEQQQRQAELEAQTKRFQFRHRHVSLFGPGRNAEYYCSGILTVLPDGTVTYDCAQTDDPSGRCDHVSFPGGSLKQVKIALDGRLHLASRGRGNFDFEGDRASIQQAQSSIAPFVQK